MKGTQIASILFASAFLVACSSVDKVEIVEREITKTPLNLPNPTPVSLEDVEFIIVTEKNAQIIFEDLKNRGISPVIIGLTDEDYEVLSLNFAEIRKYIILNRSVLQKYREYYEGDNVNTQE